MFLPKHLSSFLYCFILFQMDQADPTPTHHPCPRRPPLERWGKGVGALDSPLNQSLMPFGGLHAARHAGAGLVPGELLGRDRGGCWWQIVWWGFILIRGLQDGELGVGGRAEGGGMRLEGEEGGRGKGRRAVGEGWGGNRSSGIDGAVVGGYLECVEAECEGNEQE